MQQKQLLKKQIENVLHDIYVRSKEKMSKIQMSYKSHLLYKFNQTQKAQL